MNQNVAAQAISHKPKITPIRQPKPTAWWDISDLIIGLDEDPAFKLLLLRIARHTNSRAGYGWTKQATLAWELQVNPRTVRRFFDRAVTLGIVEVERIRTGKRPEDQYNRYRLVPSALRKLQRPESSKPHPKSEPDDLAPVQGQTPEHRTPMSYDTQPNTGHLELEHRTFATGTQGTHARIGLEVKQVEIKAEENHHHQLPRIVSSNGAEPPKPDDDDSFSVLNSSQPKPKDPELFEASLKLIMQHYPEQKPANVLEVIRDIDSRATNPPATPAFFLKAFANHLRPRETKGERRQRKNAEAAARVINTPRPVAVKTNPRPMCQTAYQPIPDPTPEELQQRREAWNELRKKLQP